MPLVAAGRRQGIPHRTVHLVLGIKVQAGPRRCYLHIDNVALTVRAGAWAGLFLVVRFTSARLTLTSSPTISGSLTLATLPDVIIKTRNRPSGRSGL